MDKFAAKFAEDPAYSLSWSAPLFTAAGKVAVGGIVKKRTIANTKANKPEWSDDELADKIVQDLLREVLQKAKWPESSTSQPSNEMALRKNAALAEVVDRCMFGGM